MDQALISSFRKNLESKSTEELRNASEDKSGKSPEELEAIRLVLAERSTNGTRAILALASGVVLATLGAVGAWQVDASREMVLLSGVVGAILGLACWYIPGLIPFVRV